MTTTVSNYNRMCFDGLSWNWQYNTLTCQITFMRYFWWRFGYSLEAKWKYTPYTTCRITSWPHVSSVECEKKLYNTLPCSPHILLYVKILTGNINKLHFYRGFLWLLLIPILKMKADTKKTQQKKTKLHKTKSLRRADPVFSPRGCASTWAQCWCKQPRSLSAWGRWTPKSECRIQWISLS